MVTTSQVRPGSGGTAVSPRKDEWSTLSMAGGVLPESNSTAVNSDA